MKPTLLAARVCCLLAAATLLLPLACQPAPPTGVLLINIDTLRPDHLGAYGYAYETSPNFDALAKESLLFRHAVAPAPWTLPSVATLFTSLYPTVHGASRMSEARKSHRPGFKPSAKLADAIVTLPEILQGEGFATAAFVRGAYPSSVYGFGQGFEHFEDNESHGLRFSTERLFAWLDREAPERFFIYLHTIEVHSPYRPMPPSKIQLENLGVEARRTLKRSAREEGNHYRTFGRMSDYSGEVDGSIGNLRDLMRPEAEASREDRKHMVELYDRGIRYTDHWLGEIVASLRERGLFESTLIVITSDHGEEFWDHDGLEHGHTYYDELLRVPLLMHVPGEGGDTVVEQQVGLIDVLPTILDIVGVAPASGIQGRSLRPLWTGGELEARSYFAESNHVAQGLAMRTERWKLIRGRRGSLRLFDLWSDPNENHNVCEEHGEVCRELAGELQAWSLAMKEARDDLDLANAPAAEPDDETIERLRALGYID